MNFLAKLVQAHMLTKVASLLKFHPDGISLPLHSIVRTAGEAPTFMKVTHWLNLLDDVVHTGPSLHIAIV